jgi:hypothetical protein
MLGASSTSAPFLAQETTMKNQETTADPSVRACKELFELLVEFCGTRESAKEVWKRAFWFSFDGKSAVVIPEHSVAQFAGWINGATKLMRVLVEDGFSK